MSSMIKITAILLAGQAVAAATLRPVTLSPSPRAAQTCYSGETATLTCYTAPNNTPQDVTVADITYVAAYLRSYGKQTKAGRMFTMNGADTPDCAEWTLYARNTVTALAKHISPPSVNSSVLFEDIANTIDGGATATDKQKQAAIIGCLTDGGSLGVVYNASSPAYNTAAYKAAGYVPGGILIKIVNSAGA
ncbi:hypothetical protein B0T22DRAFT_513615 [Podospora appendiculata]|uniref:Uncharacterized protein n=1 Tax=Podospora appendiculata TaxID=314037 RepID=A0AAE1CD97_9PEZI|nr:hypothetical protein B0T22DRAFT_513615 [Podospora appendiculata]